MLEMSRKCVPYTPVTTTLNEMRIALVSSTGLYLEGQEPYSDDGDESSEEDIDAKSLAFRFSAAHIAGIARRIRHTAARIRSATGRSCPCICGVVPVFLIIDLARRALARRDAEKDRHRHRSAEHRAPWRKVVTRSCSSERRAPARSPV